MSNKGIETSLKVLRTLLCLFNKNCTVDDIIQELKEYNRNKDIAPNVINTYINTCKACCIDIEKYGNHYSLSGLPFTPRYNDYEKKLLYDLQDFSAEFDDKTKLDIVSNFLFKLHIPFSRDCISKSLTNNIETEFNKAQEVMYMLSGKLAERYQPRENETVILSKAQNRIYVTNKCTDKMSLIKRLMRYGSYCRIIAPQDYVDSINEEINKTLELYMR